MTVTERIKLQAPARRRTEPKTEGVCEIIILSVGDTSADKEMCELVQRCGGKK